jgi:predicted nucleotidyltransferase
MTKEKILQKLREIKPTLEKDGFEIIGIFGSYARDEQNDESDIDIAYKIKNIDEYLAKYHGWESINKIVSTKEFLHSYIKKDIDFADIDSLNKTIKDEILKDLIHV